MAQHPHVRLLSGVLLTATGVHALGNLVQQSLPLLGPRLVEDLGISAAQLGALIGAVGAGNVLVLSAAGYLADRLDARRVLGAASAACGVATLLLATTSRYALMLVLLVAVGMGIAVTISAGGGAVFSTAPPQRRGLAVSIRQLGLPVGGILAAVLVPALVDLAGWRWVFAVEGGLFLLTALWVMRTPFPPAVRPAGHLRVPLARDELRSLLRLGLLGLVLSAAQWGFLGYLPLQMTDRFGLSLGLAASVFLAAQAAGLVSRLLFGWMSDRRGGDRVAVLLLMTVVGAGTMLVLAGLPPGSSPVLVAATAAVAGFCLLGWNGVLITAFAESAAVHHASLAIGIGLTFVGIGMMVAPVALGAAGVARSPALFAVIAAVLAAAVPLLIMQARSRPRATTDPSDRLVREK